MAPHPGGVKLSLQGLSLQRKAYRYAGLAGPAEVGVLGLGDTEEALGAQLGADRTRLLSQLAGLVTMTPLGPHLGGGRLTTPAERGSPAQPQRGSGA